MKSQLEERILVESYYAKFGNMSRIGKQEIILPEGVTASIEDGVVTVKGPKGELSAKTHRDIAVEIADGKIVCSIARNSKQGHALWGTTRANVANLVKGVSDGFKKELELHGVGYKAELKGKDLEIRVGYSHSILIPAPEGITFLVEKEKITIEGIDKQEVGQVASDIRAHRKPEPYKGKGIRYVGERVRRKVGKVVGAIE